MKIKLSLAILIVIAAIYGQVHGQLVTSKDLMAEHTPRNIQGGYTAADFWEQWDSTNPRMALFVLITPQSFWTGRNPIGFTSNTRNMTLPGHSGVTFYSAPGISPSAVEMAQGESTNLEMMGVYQTGMFEQADLAAGLWDYAEYEIFSASWQNTSLGEVVWSKGNLSTFKDYQTFFNAEGRGLIGRLSNEVDKVTQRLCRVKDFRDAECGHTNSTVVIAATTYEVVQSNLLTQVSQPVVHGTVYLDTGTWTGNIPPNGFFAGGKITGTTGGENNGISREIADSTYHGGLGHMKIFLKQPFPYLYSASGDFFTIVAGCNRTAEDCKKFSNIVNFRAEPFVPGIESANRILDE